MNKDTGDKTLRDENKHTDRVTNYRLRDVYTNLITSE